MTVDVTSAGAGLNLVIQSPEGMRWFGDAAAIDDGYRTTRTVTLQETGDYHVTLIKPDHTSSINFEVTLTIQ